MIIFENIKTGTFNIYKTFHPTFWKGDICFQGNKNGVFQGVRRHLWEPTVLFQVRVKQVLVYSKHQCLCLGGLEGGVEMKTLFPK